MVQMRFVARLALVVLLAGAVLVAGCASKPAGVVLGPKPSGPGPGISTSAESISAWNAYVDAARAWVQHLSSKDAKTLADSGRLAVHKSDMSTSYPAYAEPLRQAMASFAKAQPHQPAVAIDGAIVGGMPTEWTVIYFNVSRRPDGTYYASADASFDVPPVDISTK